MRNCHFKLRAFQEIHNTIEENQTYREREAQKREKEEEKGDACNWKKGEEG